MVLVCVTPPPRVRVIRLDELRSIAVKTCPARSGSKGGTEQPSSRTMAGGVSSGCAVPLNWRRGKLRWF